ncbi:MAG TPA: hypothetical protein VEZ70_07130 [Allosphingosinicella sp.]|nr:hypothetical protein [Allosphingosinicella sp.]
MPPFWTHYRRSPRADPQGGPSARVAEAVARLAELRRQGSRTSEERSIHLSVRIRMGPGRGGLHGGPLRWRSTRRRPGSDGQAGGVPVRPDRPGHLSGGAAAALEFEKD